VNSFCLYNELIKFWVTLFFLYYDFNYLFDSWLNTRQQNVGGLQTPAGLSTPLGMVTPDLKEYGDTRKKLLDAKLKGVCIHSFFIFILLFPITLYLFFYTYIVM